MSGLTQLVIGIMERLISRASPNGSRTFFPPERFGWIAEVERDWTAIRRELDALLVEREAIPAFHEISEIQRPITNDDKWKTFVFIGWGHVAEENLARCPDTARALGRIPGLRSAMFSILAGGKHIPPHRGPYSGVLRYHLGLLVPRPESCRIRVGSDVRSWREGRSLVFDDSNEHEVWNDSGADRAVLFVDFIRPLPFPLSLLNRLVIWKIGRMEFVKEAIERVRHPGIIAAGSPKELRG
jgi:beta-hydroxylase